MKQYEENRQKNKNNGLICIPSGNHDMCRLAKHLQGDELKLAFAFLLSMPGVPFIYYGDEIGMRQVEGLKSVEGGYSRTGARTPMQWDETTNAGFSLASPERLYIPLDASPDRPTVQGQKKGQGFSVSSGEAADRHPAGPSGLAEQREHFLCPRPGKCLSLSLSAQPMVGKNPGGFKPLVTKDLF